MSPTISAGKASSLLSFQAENEKLEWFSVMSKDNNSGLCKALSGSQRQSSGLNQGIVRQGHCYCTKASQYTSYN